MKRQALLLLAILSLGGAAIAAPPPVPGAAMPEGLVAVHSRHLDKLYLRPNANLAGYRRIMIDPVQVEFHKEWLGNINDTRHVAYVRPDDVRRIADETASSLGTIVAEAFRARGYEIAAAPEAGVLRLTPRISELYINAPDILPPGLTRSFVRDEAGEATLVLEARDALTGTLLGLVVDHRTARTTPRVNQATSVSNNFWFDTMFRRWAAYSVAAFEASKDRPRGPSAAAAAG